MRTWTREVTPGDSVSVMLAETRNEAMAAADWVAARRDRGEPVAVDVEATGLDMYAPDWLIRTVQFGDRLQAWVIPAERASAIQECLDRLGPSVAHNRTYDALALTAAGFNHDLWDSCHDTMLLAHLDDSRPKGIGPGLGLTNLVEWHLGSSLAKESEDTLKDWARANKVKMGDRYRDVPLGVLAPYAGLDVILTARLYARLSALTELRGLTSQGPLFDFELDVQRLCAVLTHRGVRLDKEYALALDEYYSSAIERYRSTMAEYGIENPNSAKQIAEALISEGVTLTAKTPSGQWAVGKEVLPTIDHPLAQLVTDYRHASKFQAAYVRNCLASAHDGRVRARINSLQARTARMSISDPPLQQLPSGDAVVRRLFVPDPGHVLCAADFAQIELRVVAALAEEESMISAILNGEDLHDNTAKLVGIDRKIAKMTNFLIVYGGGANALSTQAGIPMADAKEAISGFYRAFPKIKRYAKRLQQDTGWGEEPLVTPSGRHIKMDTQRSFAAVNYMVQSTARDIFSDAMLRVEAEVPQAVMLLPVHDEIIFQVRACEGPEEVLGWVVKAMETELFGVPISADGEMYGPSWGHGYDHSGVPAELRSYF